MSLRLLEHYTSVQGEGPRSGIMTQFVRFAGCNMRCPGWPCDTPHSIDPSIYRTLATRVTYGDLYDMIEKEQFLNVCLTGGEPFMQNNDELQNLVALLRMHGFKVEVFTNGSFTFPLWARENLNFIMDWKLVGSGEAGTKFDTRLENAKGLSNTDYIKFVVTDEEDLREAMHFTEVLQTANRYGVKFLVGAAWGRITDQEIVDFIKATRMPWRLNTQLHKHIYDPEATGV